LSAAISSGLRTSSNPAQWKGHLENIYPQHNKIQEHHAALPYAELPAFMERLVITHGIAALALQYTILNASRTGEVLFAERTEVVAYPAQTGRSSHRKLISDPTANWTVIPGQPDHFGA
jgi:hypothetical protein